MSKRKRHREYKPQGTAAAQTTPEPSSSTPLVAEQQGGGTDSTIEKLSQLEKLVRASGRDSLTLVRGLQDLQASLQTALTRLDTLELDVKGVSQTVWRAAQEGQQASQAAEEHFAAAVRDLEKRVREELALQAQRTTLRALWPALDDMDLVLAQQSRLAPDANDPFLRAMQLVRLKFRQGLHDLGFDEIEVQPGQTKYDPAQHDVVEKDVEAPRTEDDNVAPGTIIFVRRAGYTHEGRVYRAPQVFVKEEGVQHG